MKYETILFRGSCYKDTARDTSEPETFRYEQREVHWDHGLRLVRDQYVRGRSRTAPGVMMSEAASLTILQGQEHQGIGFRLAFTMVED